MENNIVPGTIVTKTPVVCINFFLPNGQGEYRLYCHPSTLELYSIEFWREVYGEDKLLHKNKKALSLFCYDIDDALEAHRHIPHKVWDVIKANPKIRSLWFL